MVSSDEKSPLIRYGRLLLLVVAPLMISALSVTPDSTIRDSRLNSNCLVKSNACFRSIERLVERDPNWLVIGRDFHPMNPDWALILRCDSVRFRNQIGRCGILVIEHQRSSKSVLATMRLSDALPVDPVELDEAIGGRLVKRLRGDLSFRSFVVGSTDRLDLPALVRSVLDMTVREFEEPDVSLTLPHL